MKRIILALVALFLIQSSAFATCSGACFWIGGTGTLNLTSDSAHWATTSGGTTCSCEPATTDTITFDGSSGGGTVTVNTGGTWTNAGITLTAFTGTLDFSANNNSVTTTGNVDDNGTTATFNMGNGTWTLNGASAFFRVASGATNFHSNSSTISFTAAGAAGTFRRLFGNGNTFSTVNIGANSNGAFVFVSNATFATLTAGAPNRLTVANGSTITVTGPTTITGSSGSEIVFTGDGLVGTGSGAGTYSSANNLTCTWCAIGFLTFSGGGTFTATNSFDLGANSGITIAAPSAGGGGGGHIIGG